MTLDDFLKKLNDNPETVTFDDTMAAIADNYEFAPAAFTNGELRNEAGQNSGSCKLFAFAQINGLSKEQTLACFGVYYREDVLKNPAGGDHQNIRNFMRHGWEGVRYDGVALKAKRA